jgi:hypothetical protein
LTFSCADENGAASGRIGLTARRIAGAANLEVHATAGGSGNRKRLPELAAILGAFPLFHFLLYRLQRRGSRPEVINFLGNFLARQTVSW